MHIMQDSPISFPGLFGDWQFTASSKALNIGHGVYWYGIIIAAGLMLALWFCMTQRKKYGITEDNLLDTVLWCIPTGIIGARLYYVIFYLDLYKNSDGSFNWGKAVSVWDGGLAIYGTVIAAFITAWLLSRRKKGGFRLGALTDLCVMGFLIGQAVGRWGNFMNREAFGGETTMPWRMRLWTSASAYIEVHPTFFYESLWNVIGLLLIVFVVSKARRFDGENTWFYFLWYGIGRFWVEGLRTDSLYLFDWKLFGEPIRVSQVLSLVMVIVSAAMLFYFIRIKKRKPEGLYVNQLHTQASTGAVTGTAAADPSVDTPADGADDNTASHTPQL
jgi:phosphatidylglycerol:prolipoprotein diacylglycerol transferase